MTILIWSKTVKTHIKRY